MARLRLSLDAYVQSGTGDNRNITAEVGRGLIEGVLAFSDASYGAAVRHLLPLRYQAWRIGGSHAQRDLLTQTLIVAAERAGDQRLLRALLAERLGSRPTARVRHAHARTYRQLCLVILPRGRFPKRAHGFRRRVPGVVTVHDTAAIGGISSARVPYSASYLALFAASSFWHGHPVALWYPSGAMITGLGQTIPDQLQAADQDDQYSDNRDHDARLEALVAVATGQITEVRQRGSRPPWQTPNQSDQGHRQSRDQARQSFGQEYFSDDRPACSAHRLHGFEQSLVYNLEESVLLGMKRAWLQPGQAQRAQPFPTVLSCTSTENRRAIVSRRSTQRQWTTLLCLEFGPAMASAFKTACCSSVRNGSRPGRVKDFRSSIPKSL